MLFSPLKNTILKEFELVVSLIETKRELKEGTFIKESVARLNCLP
jgi:hypothetical protein